MHPQLSDKRIICRDFIKALDDCHSTYPWRKFLGVCNKVKDELNHCLRTERIARSNHNRQLAKKRELNAAEALQKFHE